MKPTGFLFQTSTDNFWETKNSLFIFKNYVLKIIRIKHIKYIDIIINNNFFLKFLNIEKYLNNPFTRIFNQTIPNGDDISIFYGVYNYNI